MDRGNLAKEIKSRIKISSVVKTVVELKGRGHSFLGLCPFHQEKTPSFHVRDHVGRFKCFGCGASGDVIEFVMRLRGLGFSEAVADLAEKANIVDKPKITKTFAAKREINLLTVQSVAQEFFKAKLFSEEGKVALSYLENDRGLSKKMIEQALVGFGGNKTSEFLNFLKKRGISEQLAVDAGVLKKNQGAQFLRRITFPIRNGDGEIIAFGGRSFFDDDDGPKYVNTHSYRHYEKSQCFYGLFEAKKAILKGLTPVLVEGYFDAMAMWAMGMPALALCGTALTSHHVTTLAKLSTHVTLCFDNDDAGLRALNKSLIELLRKNFNPRLVVLDEKDPGDYLRERKLSELKNIFKNPKDALCFLVEKSAFVAVNANVSERMQKIDQLIPVFASIKRPLLRRQYVMHLAKHLHEDANLLWNEIEKKTRMGKIKSPTVTSTSSPIFRSDERLLIEILLADPSLYVDMIEILDDASLHVKELLKKIGDSDRTTLPSFDEIMENRIELTGEQARDALLALKRKRAYKITKEALSKKRQELQAFEKKGDFSSVLKTLKEGSDLLGVRTATAKKPPKEKDHAPVLEKKPPALKTPNNSSMLEEVTSFDAADDWL